MTTITDDELAEAIVAAIGDKSPDGLSPQGEASVRLALRCVALSKETAPLPDLPLATRDQRVAETMQFLVERGYTITAPGLDPKEPPAEGWVIDGLTEKESDDFVEALTDALIPNPNIDLEPNPARNSNSDLVGDGLEKAKQAVLDARNNPKDLDVEF